MLVCRPKVHYQNKEIQNKNIKGGAIVISNHTALYDVGALMFTFWKRNLRCLVADIVYTKNKFVNWFLNSIGCIKIHREAFNFTFVDKACKALENGDVIEIYPEARLPMRNESRPLPFKPSAAYIAILSGAPIIPVYTNGSYFNFRHRTHIMIGERIDPNTLIDPALSEKENIEKITEHLRNVIIGLGNELEKEIKT